MLQDIDTNISLVNQALDWARQQGKLSFPVDQFRKFRRELTRMRGALASRSSAAAYGESQVGKSYLISSLLSSPEKPFVIENQGQKFSFIDDLNPSGGNNNKIESTGVVTRFTLQPYGPGPEGMVRVLLLSVPDIILMLADSYYNDVKISPDSAMATEAINRQLSEMSALWRGREPQHHAMDEDDIYIIFEYFRDVIGTRATAVYQSNFCKVLAPIITRVPVESWVDVFSLLWNRNPDINRLFSTLITAYQSLGFESEVFVPFQAVKRQTGSLLKIEWLDTVCGSAAETTDETHTEVFDVSSRMLSPRFSKGELSALAAEITFHLPGELGMDRAFLNHLDLLDFPGARSREQYREDSIVEVIPKMLRRGKVAYLFNKYSRDLRISSVLFCHHNDQKAEPTLGETINQWIDDNIGPTPGARADYLAHTAGISPMFLVATKFNLELQSAKTDSAADPQTLDKHWDRFDTVLPEIIKPHMWMDQWSQATASSPVKPFQGIYLLRDFYWSCKNGVFEGFSDRGTLSRESAVRPVPGFPDYMNQLRESFLRHSFVRSHFANPAKAWDEAATLNNDGSKAIIRDLDAISGTLDEARTNRYRQRLLEISKQMLDALSVFYEPEDLESKNRKVRLIAGDIRRSLTQSVARDPLSFGRILDALMVKPEQVRNVAYDILFCHTQVPVDNTALHSIRALAGIDQGDTRDNNISRLLDRLLLDDEQALTDYLESLGLTVDDVLSSQVQEAVTMGEVLARGIFDHWVSHLQGAVASAGKLLPHADEVVFMLVSLFTKLDMERRLSERFEEYLGIFDENELPNAIGDCGALLLNKFVSTVGAEYIPDEMLHTVRQKASLCNLTLAEDSAPSLPAASASPLSAHRAVEEALETLDRAVQALNQSRVDMALLSRLPFWANYQRWEKSLMIGLILSSDISHTDPVSNRRLREMLQGISTLYQS